MQLKSQRGLTGNLCLPIALLKIAMHTQRKDAIRLKTIIQRVQRWRIGHLYSPHLNLRICSIHNLPPLIRNPQGSPSRRNHSKGGGGVDVGWGPLRSPSSLSTLCEGSACDRPRPSPHCARDRLAIALVPLHIVRGIGLPPSLLLTRIQVAQALSPSSLLCLRSKSWRR